MSALFALFDALDPWPIATFLALALWAITEWQLRHARERYFNDGVEVGRRFANFTRRPR